MKHRAAVNILLLFWAFCFARVAFAATFADEVRGFDIESLLMGALAGLLGGVLRTIFTLANDNRVIFTVLKEARRDLLISFMAGGFAYLVLAAIESKWPGTVTREIRFVAVLAAGWTRTAVFTQAGRLVKSGIDGKAHELRGGAPIDPPASAAAPLEPQK